MPEIKVAEKSSYVIGGLYLEVTSHHLCMSTCYYDTGYCDSIFVLMDYLVYCYG